MADVSKVLHDAVSSSVVEICQKVINFSTAIRITGNIMFHVDGEQQLSVTLSEEIEAAPRENAVLSDDQSTTRRRVCGDVRKRKMIKGCRQSTRAKSQRADSSKTNDANSDVSSANSETRCQRKLEARNQGDHKSPHLKANSSADAASHICEVCGHAFKYRSYLKLHSSVHANERTFICSTCGKSFKTASNLRSHYAVHKLEASAATHPCDECGKSFRTRQRLVAHMARHAGTKPRSCEKCGRIFSDLGGLTKHLKSVHATEAQFSCPACGKTATRLDNLRVHMRTHKDPNLMTLSPEELAFPASISNQTPVETTPSVTAHMPPQGSLHHRKLNSAVHMCEVCGSGFRHRTALKRHSWVHANERKFSCSTCGKHFRTASTLYSHKYLHKADAIARHDCTECGKSFRTKQQLLAHEFRHTGAKPHACQKCEKAFPDRGGLVKHLRTVHVTKPQYGCPSCGKMFKRLDNLRVHMKNHGDPKLLTMTAEELTVSVVAKPSQIEHPAKVIAPTSLATVQNLSGCTPISAICLLPSNSDAVRSHCQSVPVLLLQSAHQLEVVQATS